MEDQAWLGGLRRDLYRELFVSTFSGWDEVPDAREFSECLTPGGISIIKIDGTRVDMIQVFDQSDAVEVDEIQVQPSHQNPGIDTQVLTDAITRGHAHGKKDIALCGPEERASTAALLRIGLSKDCAQRYTQSHVLRLAELRRGARGGDLRVKTAIEHAC